MFEETILSGSEFEVLIESILDGQVGSMSRTCSRCGRNAVWQPIWSYSYCFCCGERKGDFIAAYAHKWPGGIEVG
jgi:hypothetical protein